MARIHVVFRSAEYLSPDWVPTANPTLGLQNSKAEKPFEEDDLPSSVYQKAIDVQHEDPADLWPSMPFHHSSVE
jgi:hypothetical protein